MKRAALALLAVAACHTDKPRLSIGVAASLRSAMPELVAAYENQTGIHVDIRFGPSDALAKQVHDGAALDALVVADDGVLDAELAATRQVIATNPIVLVGPAGTATDFAHLASLPGAAKVAVGDPASVPIGRYARQYLQQLGSWDALQPRLALGGDAAAVLALAQSGKAEVAIVYRSDSAQAAPLVVLDAPPSAPVARIAVDVVASSRHRAAAEGFAHFLLTPPAQAILAAHQLAPPTTPVTSASASAASAASAATAHKPPDEMDEKMRHCPLALTGATSSVQNIAGGVRFTIHAPDPLVEEVRQRAHHIVDFAAKRTHEGHGEFDGQGGGHMKNCPVVTDDVTIEARDITGGAELDVVSASGHVEELRTATRDRVSHFPFTNATITQVP